nr:uncharacterized protein LOC107177859 [Ipomoea trifida]
MNKVTGISESILISMFIAGLKSHIRRELQRARPTSLMETFALAREYEVHHEELRMELSRERRSVPWWQNKNITSITPTSSNNISSTNVGVSQLPATTTLPLPSNRTQNKTANSTLPIRRLTPQEMREKRAKGLCYNCDQQYTTNHRCQSKFLLLLGTDDGEEEGDNAEVGELPTHMSDEETIVLGDISSLHAMAGPGNPRSLQLWGQVSGDQIQVLIDGGSTHNFIQPSIAERLNLATKQVTPFRVYIGNGDSLACTYCCQNATLVMQGNEFEVDLYVLPIQGPDVVLGVQWLQSLGKFASSDFVRGSILRMKSDEENSGKPAVAAAEYVRRMKSDEEIRGKPPAEDVRDGKTTPKGDKKGLDELEIVRSSYELYQTFKGFIIDHTFIINKDECGTEMKWFRNLDVKKAFRVMEMELYFMYEAMFTKMIAVEYWMNNYFWCIWRLFVMLYL